MRVLLTMTAREVGGAELYAKQLVKALATECQFTVAMSDHSEMGELSASMRPYADVLTFPFDQPARLPSVVRQLQRLGAAHDLIHVNSNHPASRLGILMAGALGGRRMPVVCVEQRVTAVSDVRVPPAIAWALPALFRWSRQRVARVIAVSEENARMLVQHYGLPADNIRVIHNAVDLDPYYELDRNKDKLRAELGLAADDPIVLVLARLTPNKGHRFLIQAAPAILNRFPRAHFVFAGDAAESAGLESQIRSLNLTGKFSILGFRTDVPDLLCSSDVFVLPSLGEGFSLSIVEAMAARLPVVATRVGGAAEAISDGENGFLVPPADAQALADAVIRALSLDDPSRERMGQAALETARRFSVEEMAKRTLQLYREVIDLWPVRSHFAAHDVGSGK